MQNTPTVASENPNGDSVYDNPKHTSQWPSVSANPLHRVQDELKHLMFQDIGSEDEVLGHCFESFELPEDLGLIAEYPELTTDNTVSQTDTKLSLVLTVTKAKDNTLDYSCALHTSCTPCSSTVETAYNRITTHMNFSLGDRQGAMGANEVELDLTREKKEWHKSAIEGIQILQGESEFAGITFEVLSSDMSQE
jgi:hypothetical protein